MDPNQLLNLCFRIGECARQLEAGAELVELHLTTLAYVEQEAPASADASLKCVDRLVELNSLSQAMVHLLDELNTKLSETAPGSVEHEIASQQLAYFGALWLTELTPRLERLSAQHLGPLPPEVVVMPAAEDEPSSNVREALLRLRGSVGENERLIAGLAANVDSTRATIESIYESLQVARLGLISARASASSAAHLLSGARCRKLVASLGLALLLAALLYFLWRLFLG